MDGTGALAGLLVGPDGAAVRGWLTFEAGRMRDVGRGQPPPEVAGRADLVDVGDRLVVPGFVDLHVHGGDGVVVNAATPEAAAEATRRAARFHAAHGTTSMVPTTYSDTLERLEASVEGIASVANRPGPGEARVLGVHLEGPWLSPRRPGAHRRDLLRPPSTAEADRLLAPAAGCARIVTLAPELDGALELVRHLVERGTVVAVGHTDADEAEALAAFAAGASHVTHLCNAMPPLHHRAPGPVGAALGRGDVSVELIADGFHVVPSVLGLLARAAARPVLVTDAVAAAGARDGTYGAGALRIRVEGGKVTLAGDPDVLAGSALTMDVAVRTLAVDAGAGLGPALAAAGRGPADALGRDDLGRIRPGALADLVVLDGLSVCAVVVGGDVAHDPQGLLGDAGHSGGNRGS